MQHGVAYVSLHWMLLEGYHGALISQLPHETVVEYGSFCPAVQPGFIPSIVGVCRLDHHPRSCCPSDSPQVLVKCRAHGAWHGKVHAPGQDGAGTDCGESI